MGDLLGLTDELAVGVELGLLVVDLLRLADGLAVGVTLGLSVGDLLGLADGLAVGVALGLLVGHWEYAYDQCGNEESYVYHFASSSALVVACVAVYCGSGVHVVYAVLDYKYNVVGQFQVVVESDEKYEL